MCVPEESLRLRRTLQDVKASFAESVKRMVPWGSHTIESRKLRSWHFIFRTLSLETTCPLPIVTGTGGGSRIVAMFSGGFGMWGG